MRKSNYNKIPSTTIYGVDAHETSGYQDICKAILDKVSSLGTTKTIVSIDCYPGVLDAEILPALVAGLEPELLIEVSNATHSEEDVFELIKDNLTNDRVHGKISLHDITEFFNFEKLAEMRLQLEEVKHGLVIVYGVGATLLTPPDILIYADLARWEIQLRYRAKLIANWCASNYGEDVLLMYKRGYFVDWRVADRHKQKLFEQIDFLLDTNVQNEPKMVSGAAIRIGLKQVAHQPFRTVPYFDSGVWGGQWMKNICDLDSNQINYAWCFDGVPEENSLILVYGSIRIEIPSINLVFYQPTALLGDKVYARFGAEFPIRFDMLDTISGGDLSLQVHPTTSYIQNNFGMHYTQDESYYILDAGDDACVYLGTKSGVVATEMMTDLEAAQNDNKKFDVDKYINKFSAKKHDHFLIPAGTIHCSGANSMVLEISSTPYIFTFKLWDWGRLGSDGRKRPIHLTHGKNVINWAWDTPLIQQNHVNCVEVITSGDGWVEEKTGLHNSEFIETRRHWFSKIVFHDTCGGVNVLNLVEGEEAIVESPVNSFKPFIVHYAETFIIPASVGAYSIRPYGLSVGKRCVTIKAFVRT